MQISGNVKLESSLYFMVVREKEKGFATNTSSRMASLTFMLQDSVYLVMTSRRVISRLAALARHTHHSKCPITLGFTNMRLLVPNREHDAFLSRHRVGRHNLEAGEQHRCGE